MPAGGRTVMVRKVINEFVSWLMELDVTQTDYKEIFSREYDTYHRRLLASGCSEVEARSFMTSNYLAMEIDVQRMTPVNHAEIAVILVRQLTVESMLRKFLIIKSPGVNWYSEHLNFATLVDLCQNCVTYHRKKFIAALKEFGRIRNNYAHKPHYRLTIDDASAMKKFLNLLKEHYEDYATMSPLEVYTEFSHCAFAYFHGMYWTGLTGEVPIISPDPAGEAP